MMMMMAEEAVAEKNHPHDHCHLRKFALDSDDICTEQCIAEHNSLFMSNKMNLIIIATTTMMMHPQPKYITHCHDDDDDDDDYALTVTCYHLRI